MPADPRTVNRAWCAALNRHDPGAVAACFAVDATFTDHGSGQRAQGRTAVRESTEEWLKAVSDLRIKIVSATLYRNMADLVDQVAAPGPPRDPFPAEGAS